MSGVEVIMKLTPKQAGKLYMEHEQLKELVAEMQACVDMADKFYSEVLPQAGKMVFQDYATLNELGVALSKLKSK